MPGCILESGRQLLGSSERRESKILRSAGPKLHTLGGAMKLKKVVATVVPSHALFVAYDDVIDHFDVLKFQ